MKPSSPSPQHSEPIDTPELDSDFLTEFRKLKGLRNNRHMDEPEFDVRVEQLAADTYAHKTENGYCCACSADIAFMESQFKEREAEIEIKLLRDTAKGFQKVLQPEYAKGGQAAIDALLKMAEHKERELEAIKRKRGE